jgi:hypothetical protein
VSEPLDPTWVKLWSAAIEATEKGDRRTLEAAREAQTRLTQQTVGQVKPVAAPEED